MKKIFTFLYGRLQDLDRNERAWLMGLILMLIGLTYTVSLFMALTVVGAAMAAESVLTSYLAIYFGSKGKE